MEEGSGSIRSDPRPGSDIAGYRLEELLGRGGMGAVYRAEDLRLRRMVALKLLAPELAENERFRERFLRESQLAASLDHPHIVPIYAAGEAEGQLYLAMRYVEGYDLRQLLATEGRLQPGPALELFEQVADALDAAHEKGLIHRDVKPGNVLIAVRSGRRHCYLADFGLTKQTSSISGLTGTGELVGTVNYVSPEQIRGEAVDGRADVYALGCMLYECLTGEPPFTRDSEVATLWAHVNEPPAALAAARPELGRDIDRVLARALAKAPGDRYESCRELAGAAGTALGVSSASAPALPLPRRARRLGLPRGWVGRLLAAGTAALLAAAVALVVLLRGPDGLSGIGPKSVGVIDPATGELVADIPLGFKSALIAAGEGSIWVVDPNDNTLTKIDPTTMEIVPPTRRIPDEDIPIGLAVGEGSVWIAVNQMRNIAVHRFGPELGELRDTILLEASPDAVVVLAVGERAVWALEVRQPERAASSSTRGAVTRIDPATGTAELLAEGLDALSLAVGGGAVWLGGAVGVTKLDLETGAAIATTVVAEVAEQQTTSIAVGADAVWFAGSSQPRLSRVNLAGAVVLDSFKVGDRPSAVAVSADGIVWAANSGDGTISRVDPQTESVETIRLGAPPLGIVVAYDRVWTSTGEPAPAPGSESALAEFVPNEIWNTCAVDGVPRAGAVESAVCVEPADPSLQNAPDRLQISIHSSENALGAAYAAEQKLGGVTRDGGRCDGTLWRGSGPWLHEQLVDEPVSRLNRRGGQGFCYFDDGDAVVVWTHESLGQANHQDVLAIAREAGNDHASLFAWWSFWRHRIGKAGS